MDSPKLVSPLSQITLLGRASVHLSEPHLIIGEGSPEISRLSWYMSGNTLVCQKGIFLIIKKIAEGSQAMFFGLSNYPFWII